MLIYWRVRGAEEKRLRYNHEIIYGWIHEFGYSAGGATIPTTYIFKLKNEEYSEAIKSSRFCKNLSSVDKGKIRGVKYPIAYSPENPEINRIILSKADYLKYNLPYPDSLAFFLDEYFNCD